jgi:hypothetical protein
VIGEIHEKLAILFCEQAVRSQNIIIIIIADI